MKKFFRRLRFWLFQRGKQCKSCCLFCGYYDLCSYDFRRVDVEDASAAFNDLGSAAAKAGASMQELSEAFSEALKKASGGN